MFSLAKWEECSNRTETIKCLLWAGCHTFSVITTPLNRCRITATINNKERGKCGYIPIKLCLQKWAAGWTMDLWAIICWACPRLSLVSATLLFLLSELQDMLFPVSALSFLFWLAFLLLILYFPTKASLPWGKCCPYLCPHSASQMFPISSFITFSPFIVVTCFCMFFPR